MSLWFKIAERMFTKRSQGEDCIVRQVAVVAIKINKRLGAGLLESVYKKCLDFKTTREHNVL